MHLFSPIHISSSSSWIKRGSISTHGFGLFRKQSSQITYLHRLCCNLLSFDNRWKIFCIRRARKEGPAYKFGTSAKFYFQLISLRVISNLIRSILSLRLILTWYTYLKNEHKAKPFIRLINIEILEVSRNRHIDTRLLCNLYS